jgi:leader peptidase (prepilin peptidase)/N-methyltransferase
MESVLNLSVLCFLSWESLQDIKRQQLSLKSIIIFFILGLILRFFVLKTGLAEIISGMLLGIFCLVLSRLTGEAIGYGDGLVILVVGEYLGIKGAVLLLFISFGIMMAAAILVMLKKGFRYNAPLPFVPCILAAYVGGMLL